MLMRRRVDDGGLTVAPATRAAFDEAVLAADPRHHFLRHAWFAAGSKAQMQAITVRRADGSPLAVFPRVRRKIGPARVSEVPGSYWPFRSIPIAADAAPDEVAAALSHDAVRAFLGPVWRLGPVFSDDPALRCISAAASEAGWTMLVRKLGTCFEFDFAALRAEGPWPRTSSQASNRRRERKLAALGSIEYRFLSGHEWTDADRDAMALVEERSWLPGIGAEAAPKFLDPARRRMWEQAAEDPVLAGMMFCSLMIVGGEPAAFAFGVEAGGVRHCIANSYSRRFAQHGPGKLLLYKDFERAADRGVARVNWGSGDAGYKSEMGASAGADIVDLLLARGPALALPLRRFWTRATPSS